MESSDEESDLEAEVDLAELKNGHPYVCSLLKKIPDNEKSNVSKLKSGKRYIFDAEAAAIFEKERMKKELDHREKQARQKQPIQRMKGRYPRGKGQKGQQPPKISLADNGKGATPSVFSQIVFSTDGETNPKGVTSPVKLDKGKAVVSVPIADKDKGAYLDEKLLQRRM
ncbi:hypothetical protein Ahy_B07g088614 isoform A [Arachis hypogaea]|uniref:Uncharacterized protein n=1 Tax=Arachis hypogaea TaxID=3818 RepID=A0A444YEZ1_ARAHY|nr:hypothetical protein Ahy_B07g088614 isoform A [Arachis hypogaea]